MADDGKAMYDVLSVTNNANEDVTLAIVDNRGAASSDPLVVRLKGDTSGSALKDGTLVLGAGQSQGLQASTVDLKDVAVTVTTSAGMLTWPFGAGSCVDGNGWYAKGGQLNSVAEYGLAVGKGTCTNAPDINGGASHSTTIKSQSISKTTIWIIAGVAFALVVLLLVIGLASRRKKSPPKFYTWPYYDYEY